MKRLVKVALGLTLFLMLGMALYAYKYHSLAMEGWILFNTRCNVVSPALIKTHNLHIGLGAALSGQSSPSVEQFRSDLAALPEAINQYLPLEKDWLTKQGALLNRWDFKLLEPEYVKTAGRYQLAMYQGYYDYYQTIGEFFDQTNKVKDNLPNDTVSLVDKYYEVIHSNEKLYNQAFDAGVKTNDWRKIFAQVPEPKCRPEYLIIP